MMWVNCEINKNAIQEDVEEWNCLVVIDENLYFLSRKNILMFLNMFISVCIYMIK